MPAPTQSQPSTARLPPQSTQTQLMSSTDPLDEIETLPPVIPPSHDPAHDARTIILCFDGTGDQFNADNSNIIQFFSMLKKDDKSQQMVYYQAGIGTYTIPEIATPFWSSVQKKIDAAFANHLDAHVMGGYEFLMENYHAEDKICIFGFSRGAYTARALAGMLHKVGLLPAGNHQQVPFAYKMFSRDDNTGWEQSKGFKKAFSIDVEIEFVGVWDTVCSVGIASRTLPFTASNTSIRYFRHAISLDEHRAKFNANRYQPQPAGVQKGTKLGEMPRSNQRHPYFHKRFPHQDHKSEMQSESDEEETNVKEVWFAGCHCDVGGGSVANGTRNSLARIPLRWMIRQCFLAKTGIQFHRDSFKEVGLDPSTLFPIVKSRPPALMPSIPVNTDVKGGISRLCSKARSLTHKSHGLLTAVPEPPFKSEEEEELVDAQCKIYDQLKIAWGWWIVEILPMRHHMQSKGKLKSYWQMHLGRPRRFPGPIPGREKISVHRSVNIRKEARRLVGETYKPKANFEDLENWHERVELVD